jgi:predicted nucleic acid-binding protein
VNLQELTEKLVKELGEKGKEQAALYGPTALLMTQADLTKWIEYVFTRREADAYALYLKAASNADILANWDEEGLKWKQANADNADRIEMGLAIGQAMAKAMLNVILALVVV